MSVHVILVFFTLYGIARWVAEAFLAAPVVTGLVAAVVAVGAVRLVRSGGAS